MTGATAEHTHGYDHDPDDEKPDNALTEPADRSHLNETDETEPAELADPDAADQPDATKADTAERSGLAETDDLEDDDLDGDRSEVDRAGSDGAGFDHGEPDETTLIDAGDRPDGFFTPRHAATDDHQEDAADHDAAVDEVAGAEAAEDRDGVASGQAPVAGEQQPAGTVYDHGTPVDNDGAPVDAGTPGDDGMPLNGTPVDDGTPLDDDLSNVDTPIYNAEPVTAAGPDVAAVPVGVNAGAVPGTAGVSPAAETSADVAAGGDADGKWWPSDATSEVTERWRDAQIAFVDDPAAAVRQGRETVEDAVRRLTEALSSQVERVSGGSTDGGDTEALRQVMRGYHRLLDRLVDL